MTEERVDPEQPTSRLEGVRPGARLKDRYRVEREIGRGGIGIVFLARDEQLHDRAVVIKILLDPSADSGWFEKKFRQEVEALVRIDHPGVVGALDAGQVSDGTPFLVMQFVQGVTLRSLIKDGLLPLASVADIVRQVGAALTAAHEKGSLHRDLKPENIMIQDLGHGERLVKNIDFGIASIRDPGDYNVLETKIAGTVLYMAPEQLLGRPEAASDIYALGVIAYELLAGEPPFKPASPFELPALQRRGVQLRPSQRRPAATSRVDAPILKALAVEPRDRPASARELGDALQRALVDAVAPAPVQLEPDDHHLTGNMDTSGTSHSATSSKSHGHLAWSLAPWHEIAAADTVSKARGFARAASGLVVVAIFAGAAWWVTSRVPIQPMRPSAGPSASLAAPLELSYSLPVQRYRAGKPYREPFDLAREMLFGPDDRLRLNVASPQGGYLYVVNQGPEPRTGKPSYNVLFPTTINGSAPAGIPAGQRIQIPEESWFKFDEERGAERLWLVFSGNRVPAFEALSSLANPTDKGVVSSASRIDALQRILTETTASAVIPQESENRTVLRAPGDVLVRLIKLEHQ